jgi:hypothetical protein
MKNSLTDINKEDNYWKDKNGGKHFIPEMETEHLINIVNKIEAIRRNWQENKTVKENIKFWESIIEEPYTTAEEREKYKQQIKEYKEYLILYKWRINNLLKNSNTSFTRRYKGVIKELSNRIDHKIKETQ